ncbi:putative amidohydrolase YtcJ [Microbacteriaceae bacterium SG_E_30_P1]|uniref:Amidohydrolase YtcJ n=1 Tax=Antiquaquibacter oligotrophicus TaxID=2880260 RepID=A0ABT6KQE1_9MICO|nr:amidohydrolase [Antiquaquibacter oligotrophicus]MDH6181412.1 putative amidohydrolase YtcJ [Antiquaquibacter oligotrophicus]UDF12896.1 amidohydrolase [Antiquaquibacter oligotrophicus]
MTEKILTAGAIITMVETSPRVTAIAIKDDRIVAVGSLAECRAALPGAEHIDTGAAVLMPGFIEPHGHPLLGGVVTQSPAHSIAPWDAPTWDDVLAVFQSAADTTTPGIPLVFNGFDALLHGRPAPFADELDDIFGDRVVVIFNNSGHAAYFTTALMKLRGWDATPPENPVGGTFGRRANGALDGTAYEVPATTEVIAPVLQQLGGNVLASAAEYYALMARAGITSTSDMTFSLDLQSGYEALAALPSCPLRLSMWQVSSIEGFAEPVSFVADDALIHKAGVKLWTDGSPWIGNIAVSFPYLDTDATKRAGIDPATAGRSMNYGRPEVDAVLDACASRGWQMAFHANGDDAIDFALDAYERALAEHGLLGTDHRWRLEHVGAGRRDQFERAASLGVHVSMAPFQFYYWGDLLDGEMFDSEHGARWQAFQDAVSSGTCVSLHNDGSVSPPTPILNVQTAVTRATSSGKIHAPEQAITLDQALRAHTIDAARSLHRDSLVGSIAPGKLADLVELTADPYEVEPTQLNDKIKVLGTWLGGARITLDDFVGAATGHDPAQHAHLAGHARRQHCC